MTIFENSKCEYKWNMYTSWHLRTVKQQFINIF